MSGGGKSAATQCDKCVVGMPVEQPAHPTNQHTATWIANEARPASFQSNHLNAAVSRSVSDMVKHNKSEGDNPYLQMVPGWNSVNNMCTTLNRCGKRFDDAKQKAEELAGNFWHHLRTSPSIRDAAIARLAQGTKMLKEGGRDKVFEHTFEILPQEEILKAYACYLSRPSGLVIGTLYLSNKRLVFGGDNPRQHAPSGKQEWMYYKVDMLLDNLSFVTPGSKMLDPSEKYIQVVTRDGYDFWFMGFVSYDKALKNINEALQKHRDRKLEEYNHNDSPNGEQISDCI
ncbi:GEM-like protein 1 [Syzygium oleosum]|uniref:GEM-like protein 1 n=1 Tax=Syzygium oleosum TaxID=219896 RepID=UPI0024B8F8FD|nr:GEM-like protein 1 [Syzygium oleosum]